MNKIFMTGDIYERTTKRNTDNPAGLLVSGRDCCGISEGETFTAEVTVDVAMMTQAFVGDITL